MMRKKNIRNIVIAACMCMLLCSCTDGRAKDTIIIGSGEGQEMSGVPNGYGAADDGAGQSGAEADALSGVGAEPGAQEEMIRVYVCGAVMNPGVVSVPAGSRAEDALTAAGGFSEEAGREAVNLADWITDGQMLYFPTEEEALETKEQEAMAESGLININTADAAQLCTLPGIGESRAADIIAYREKNGAFASCEDIMKVSGIKESVYEKIREKITVK